MEKLKDVLISLPATAMLSCMIMGLANVSSVLANVTFTGDTDPQPSEGLLQIFGMATSFILMVLAGGFMLLIVLRFYLIDGYRDPSTDRGTAVRLCFGLMATQAALIFSYDEPHIALLTTVGIQMTFMIGFFIFTRDQESPSS